MEKDFSREILDANIAVHDVEAQYYDVIHSEIFNKIEQKRLGSTIKKADALIEHNEKRALDFGAGTGNMTGKLLAIGYRVTAVDISEKMICTLERKYASQVANKTLVTLVGEIESMNLPREGFDLVTCYSVLHHLPDYLKTLRTLASLTKKGGVLLLDHEPSDVWWNRTRTERYMVEAMHLADRGLNRIHRRLAMGREKLPQLDYSMSDYWITSERHVDQELVRKTLDELGFTSATREDYHLSRCHYPNPLYWVYAISCRPDHTMWIAKK